MLSDRSASDNSVDSNSVLSKCKSCGGDESDKDGEVYAAGEQSDNRPGVSGISGSGKATHDMGNRKKERKTKVLNDGNAERSYEDILKVHVFTIIFFIAFFRFLF